MVQRVRWTVDARAAMSAARDTPTVRAAELCWNTKRQGAIDVARAR
jgi:hypothetical protein